MILMVLWWITCHADQVLKPRARNKVNSQEAGGNLPNELLHPSSTLLLGADIEKHVSCTEWKGSAQNAAHLGLGRLAQSLPLVSR